MRIEPQNQQRLKLFLNMFSAFAFVSAAIVWWQINPTIAAILIVCSVFYGVRTRRIWSEIKF